MSASVSCLPVVQLEPVQVVRKMLPAAKLVRSWGSLAHPEHAGGALTRNSRVVGTTVH